MSYKDKEKQKEYQRNWIASRRAEFFKDKECKNCQSKINLVLHHRNPEEKESHKIWSWSKERREQEIAKCDILCEKCHKKYHAELRRKLIHGTFTMYSEHGCRCDNCRNANTIKSRNYRAKIRVLN